MFAYLKGSLEEKSINYVVVDCNGVGYKIFMSENSIASLGELGEIVKIHTYLRKYFLISLYIFIILCYNHYI